MSAKDLWRMDKGCVIVSADRIRTHIQTERIYDNYYNYEKATTRISGREETVLLNQAIVN
jgi:hypothetical protein